jgi:hypothetical protein
LAAEEVENAYFMFLEQTSGHLTPSLHSSICWELARTHVIFCFHRSMFFLTGSARHRQHSVQSEENVFWVDRTFLFSCPISFSGGTRRTSLVPFSSAEKAQNEDGCFHNFRSHHYSGGTHLGPRQHRKTRGFFRNFRSLSFRDSLKDTNSHNVTYNFAIQ